MKKTILKLLSILLIGGIGVQTIISCSSSSIPDLPPPDSELSSSSQAMVLCVYSDRCTESPYGTCPGGGVVSDFCPHDFPQNSSSGGTSGTSSSSGNGLPSYEFCIFHADSQCLPGPHTSCPGVNGTLSNTCPYPPYAQTSSSSVGTSSNSSKQSSSSLAGTCPIIPNTSAGITFTDPRDSKKYKYELLPSGRVWMMENLNYSANGTLGWCYGTGTDLGIVGADGPGCADGYGRTYFWSSTNICPEGWEVPSRADWASLTYPNPSPPNDFYIHAGNYNLNASYPPLGWKGRNSAGFYWTSEANNIFVYIWSSVDIQSTASNTDRFSVRCVASATVEPKCNGTGYSLETSFCHEGTIYEHASCGNRWYNSVTQVCDGTTILAKCGEDSYNSATHFCSSCEGVLPLCGGNTYDALAQGCVGTTIVSTKCGGVFYNPATHFCSNGEILLLCDGKPYNPLIEVCNGNSVFPLCGTTPYNPALYKCENGIVTPI